MIIMLYAGCRVSLTESVSFTVKLNVPACVGVPENSKHPVAGTHPLGVCAVSPGGSVPCTVHWYPELLPLPAFRNWLYATPTVPAGRVVGAMSSGVTVTTKLKLPLPDLPCESVAVIVAGKGPAWVGVPTIKPVAASIRNPGGSPEAAQV